MKTNFLDWAKPLPVSEQLTKPYLNDPRLQGCMDSIQYQFKNPTFLIEALWHRSLKNQADFDYERYEFLGDSILQFYACLKLFNNFKEYKEGELTKALGNIVSAKALCKVASQLKLQNFIFVEDSLSKQISDSMLADVYESIIAAIFADGGIEKSFEFLDATLLDLFTEPLSNTINYKSILQEWAQKNKFDIPLYEMERNGPEHELVFTIVIKFNNQCLGPVTAKSKKIGEQKAAKLMVDSLGILNE